MSDLPAQNPAVAKGTSRRGYGTGSLTVIGRSWVGSWYGSDGRKIMRKVGPARSARERDGLTNTQAEARFRKMRESTRTPAPAGRVTMADAGAELQRRLELRGRTRSHRPTWSSTCVTT